MLVPPCHTFDVLIVVASKLTEAAEGKHHISDFLPPDELKKFMERVNAAKEKAKVGGECLLLSCCLSVSCFLLKSFCVDVRCVGLQ